MRNVPTEDSACVVPLVPLGRRSIVSSRQRDGSVPGTGEGAVPEETLPVDGLAELRDGNVRHGDVLRAAILAGAVAGGRVKWESLHPGSL